MGSSYKETIENFMIFIMDVYNKYKSIKNDSLLNYEKEEWEIFQKGKDIYDEYLTNSIRFLCKCLYTLLGKKVILLIDNYDSHFLKASNTKFYNEIYSFYGSVLTNIFTYDTGYNYLLSLSIFMILITITIIIIIIIII